MKEHRDPIGSVSFRQVVSVEGVVRSLRVVPWVETSPVLECTIYDDTGGLTLVFLGRPTIHGLKLGTRIAAHGRVVEARHRLALMNPVYDLLATVA